MINKSRAFFIGMIAYLGLLSGLIGITIQAILLGMYYSAVFFILGVATGVIVLVDILMRK